MKCNKCGNEIPSESKFCLSCGQAVPVRSETPAAVQAPKKRTAVWAVLAGLLIVALAIIFGVRGSKVTQAPTIPNPQQTPVLRAPAPPNSPQPNVLNTDVEKPPLNAPQKPQPPQEVVAYLEHLKRVDAARLALQDKEIKVFLTMLGQASAEPMRKMLELTDPDVPDVKDDETIGAAKKQMATLTSEWQQLSAYFLSVPAPPQCQALAGKYYDALRDVIIYVGKLQTFLTNQDLGVASMRGKSKPIDQELADADTELANVCTRYGIQKTFSIAGDMTQTPVLGF